ncbi:hypothetical protein EV127DRAFT_254956 [Xylaria flabelliformis]|nr:hypothetical protein EV127DRAFT_254956 [Xylaria flabelliformis]
MLFGTGPVPDLQRHPVTIVLCCFVFSAFTSFCLRSFIVRTPRKPLSSRQSDPQLACRPFAAKRPHRHKRPVDARSAQRVPSRLQPNPNPPPRALIACSRTPSRNRRSLLYRDTRVPITTTSNSLSLIHIISGSTHVRHDISTAHCVYLWHLHKLATATAPF